jgi:hypothetical protein
MSENEKDPYAVVVWTRNQIEKSACPYCCAEYYEKHHPMCELAMEERHGFGPKPKLIDSENMRLWLKGFFDSFKSVNTDENVHYLLGQNAGNKMQSQQSTQIAAVT